MAFPGHTTFLLVNSPHHSNDNIGLKLFCNKAYQNLYFMVIWFINSNELLENLILVINSKRLSNVI